MISRQLTAKPSGPPCTLGLVNGDGQRPSCIAKSSLIEAGGPGSKTSNTLELGHRGRSPHVLEPETMEAGTRGHTGKERDREKSRVKCCVHTPPTAAAVSGWWPAVRLTEAPMRLQKAVQNLATNSGPQSEKMILGNPWIQNTLCSITSAVSLAEGNLDRGMKWAILENLTITVSIVVFPSDDGAGGNVLLNVPPQTRPPALPNDKLRPAGPWMIGHERRAAQMDHLGMKQGWNEMPVWGNPH